jgi:Uma2 family endonuclease
MATLVIPTDAARYVDGPPQGKWTYADWEKLGDDGNRYEVIDGVLYVSSVPSVFHQYIIGRFLRFVGMPAEDQGLAFISFARVGVVLADTWVVQPDIILVLKSNAEIIRDRRIRGVPDLIVEVLSPGNTDYDEGVKFEAYADAGVPEYGIIDPAARQLRLYKLAEEKKYGEAQVFNETDRVTFACLPTIRFTLGDLFAGAPGTTL